MEDVMKRFTLLLVMAAAAACASSSGPSGDPAGEIARRTRDSAGAWNRGDLAAFVADYDESATFMTGKGLIGKAEMTRHYAEKYFHDGRPDQTLRFENVEVRLLGPDAAVSTGRGAVSGGGKPEQSGRFSLVWARRPNGWRIIHDHSS
jgi:uncharacterized protein (TIGR02246 family)